MDSDCIFEGLMASIQAFPHDKAVLTNVQGSLDSLDEVVSNKVPWNKIRTWRRLQQLIPKAVTIKVPLIQINSAMVLAFSGQDLAVDQLSALPDSVINAIHHDSRIFLSYHGDQGLQAL